MLFSGFSIALEPMNILLAAIGAFVGTLVGVLPGLGPTSAIAILLPLTAVLSPTQAIIMLAGIYYGAMYGGSTTSILLNIPGEVSSVPTCLDGYPLAQQGRGGPALGIAAIGSFLAGTMGVIGLTFFAPILATQALKFGPPEYLALMLLSLTLVMSLGGANISKALAMCCLGYLLSLIGMAPINMQPRLTFGIISFWDGIDVISLVIGLFAICEVLKGVEEKKVAISMGNIGSVYPGLSDLRQSAMSILRGGGLGFFMGLLPGCAPAVTTFLAYDLEKKCSKTPERFGHGAMEGVAAPESANNATSSAGFIPLFALGIPASPALAVLLGALMIYGLTPGPMLFEQNPNFVWAIIASMFIGNIMCLLLNLPLVGFWAKITQIPYGILAPIVLLICVVGAYSIRNSMVDVLVSLIFGILGYAFDKFHWPVVPFVICFILGPVLERSFLQTIGMMAGNPYILFERPIFLILIAMTVVFVIISIKLRRRTSRMVTEIVGEGAWDE